MRERGRLERVTLLEINEPYLRDSVGALQADYPEADGARASSGDFVHDLAALGPGGGRLLLFLAGTIGNLHPGELPAFFRARPRRSSRPATASSWASTSSRTRRGSTRPTTTRPGVTAEFNLNILRVLNERLGADFDPDDFEHRAFYDAERQWIEMRLRARRAVTARVPAAGIELLARGGRRDPHRALLQVHARVARATARRQRASPSSAGSPTRSTCSRRRC